MYILILGGIAEAKQLAIGLIEQSHFVIYSIAGKARQPELSCEVHTGGFSSANENGIFGLQQYCIQNRIELLIDATHPHAQIISEHATTASQLAGIPCWRLERPSWQESDFPNWHSFDSWDALWPQINVFKNVFFSIGLSALQLVERRLPKQHWVIRSTQAFENNQGITQINAIGPFSYDNELLLLQEHRIEALVCKNSGSNQVVEKLHATKDLSIPVFVQNRPKLPTVTRTFIKIASILTAVQQQRT